MAYNDSGELPISQNRYSLGGYTFELKVQNVHEPGEDPVVSVFAICRGPDGARETQAIDFPDGTTIKSWNVEANETEASVYVKYNNGGTLKPGAPSAVNGQVYCTYQYGGSLRSFYPTNAQGAVLAGWISRPEWSITPVLLDSKNAVRNNWGQVISSVVVDGVTFYLNHTASANAPIATEPSGTFLGSFESEETAIQSLVSQYFDIVGAEELVARFAIDLTTAGGGPGGGWDEPGSVEPEPGELTHTLTLTAIAALSGRHNDPLNDTSYSYMPADNLTEKPYGCGGDGGYGGGGGGGASSMVVRQIVTDKASHVEYTTRTKRHGYGSGGGKGGKGGDGCILIFY